MKKTLLLGLAFHPSIHLLSLLRAGSPNIPRLNFQIWRMSVKAQLTCTLALQQLGRGTHRSSTASLLFCHTLK